MFAGIQSSVSRGIKSAFFQIKTPKVEIIQTENTSGLLGACIVQDSNKYHLLSEHTASTNVNFEPLSDPDISAQLHRSVL